MLKLYRMADYDELTNRVMNLETNVDYIRKQIRDILDRAKDLKAQVIKLETPMNKAYNESKALFCKMENRKKQIKAIKEELVDIGLDKKDA